ncbi:hypothetical protein MA16_Dca000860 [Dendrobium catenatum]|uniref:Reverse transcriptase zinc-binding domain-containing protein n=1 Tax=Dendrobium catenatum TaxID=906689 RepID=A0A2I0WV24_9ASPA|nr:hypothetical protein MA16_Dca000860 [Dendrobium catenatum]
MIWHKKHVIKHFVFIWLALIGGLKIVDTLLIRNIQVPGTCSLYLEHLETVFHLFFECYYSFSNLNAIVPGVQSFLFRPNILQLFDWVNGAHNGKHEVNYFYKLVIYCVIYFIWKERNNRRFGNTTQCHTTLLLHIKRVLFEKLLKWKNAMDLLEKL